MNISTIYNGINDNYDIDEIFLDDMLTTLDFRSSKTRYHFNKVRDMLKTNKPLTDKEIDILYYELENLIINIRSTVDNVLQLINELYKFGLSGISLNTKNVLKNPKCTNALKDIFFTHTHPKNHFWNFIYTSRNELVHEICIKSHFPIIQDENYQEGIVKYTTYFINKNGDKENILFFYSECVKLIEQFTEGCLYVLSNGLT